MSAEPYIPSTEDPLLTVEQLAELFAVKPYTVRAWIKAGKFSRTIKLDGKHWRVPHSSMVEFANKKYGSE